MTTNVSLQCAQAAVGFAALTMGRTMAEFEASDRVPDPAAWQQATQAISQWLREQYGDEHVEWAKARLSDSVIEPEGDDECVAQAAQRAYEMTLSVLLQHCAADETATALGERVTAAMNTSWRDIYSDDAPKKDANH